MLASSRSFASVFLCRKPAPNSPRARQRHLQTDTTSQRSVDPLSNGIGTQVSCGLTLRPIGAADPLPAYSRRLLTVHVYRNPRRAAIPDQHDRPASPPHRDIFATPSGAAETGRLSPPPPASARLADFANTLGNPRNSAEIPAEGEGRSPRSAARPAIWHSQRSNLFQPCSRVASGATQGLAILLKSRDIFVT